MTLRISRVRLGLCLTLIGVLFLAPGYIEWSYLTSAYYQQCTGSAPASSCESLFISINLWAPYTGFFLAVVLGGLVATIMSFGAERWERRMTAG